MKIEETHEDLNIELENFEYRKNLGAFKPKFETIPDDYFPLTTAEAIAYAVVVAVTIGAVLGLMIGFLYWITIKGLTGFV
jgi:hypothetical protein